MSARLSSVASTMSEGARGRGSICGSTSSLTPAISCLSEMGSMPGRTATRRLGKRGRNFVLPKTSIRVPDEKVARNLSAA
jgi:hypothetical protein